MRIVITGSSGSVGKAVVKLALEEGHDILCVDRVKGDDSSAPFQQVELSEYDTVVKAFQ